MVSSRCEQVVVVEAAQRDPHAPVLAVQRREEIGERMVGGDVGVAERPEDADPHRLVARDDVAEQLDAAAVGPVQIVEHHQDRVLARHPSEQVDDAAEQHEPLRVGITPGRDLDRQPPGQLRDDSGEMTAPIGDMRGEHRLAAHARTSWVSASIHG